MRIAKFGILGALMISVIGCQADDGGVKTPNIPPLAFVRYINAVPDTFALTVRWIDQLQYTPQTFAAVPFRGIGTGGYQGLQAGSRRFRVFTYHPNLGSGTTPTAATTEQLADTTFNFVAGEYYTILHYGFARAGQIPAQSLIINHDQFPAVDAANVMVRAVNAALSLDPATNLDFSIGGTPVAAGLARGGFSAFETRAPGTFTMSFAAAGSGVEIGSGAAFAGTPGTPAVNPIGGATVGGTVGTMVAFGPSVAGSPAAAAAAPSVIWFTDRHPARTVTP